MPKVKAKFLNRDKVMARLRQLVPEAEKELAKEQIEGMQELATRVRARAPGEGNYKAGIQADRLRNRPSGERAISGKRGTKDPNAVGLFAPWTWRFSEFGTNPHIIKPKRASRLVFHNREGQRVSAGKVQHPGARRQPHIFPTWRAYRKKLRRRMHNAVNRAVRQARKKR